MKETINFRASVIAPIPTEVQYWIDLKQDPTGKVIKTWTGSAWEPITGDSEAVEELQADIAKKADKTATYTKAEVDAKVASVYRVKGSVANFAALPKTAVIGDVYNLTDTGANYVCTKANPAAWDKLSETVDLSSCVSSEEVKTMKYMTMSEYNSIATKDSQTLYLIHD